MEAQTKDKMTFEEKMNSIRDHYRGSVSTRYPMPYTWRNDSEQSVRSISEQRNFTTNNTVPIYGLDYKGIAIVKQIETEQIYHQTELKAETQVNADKLNTNQISQSEFERRMKDRKEQAHQAVDNAFDALIDHGLKNPSQQNAILTATDAIYDFFVYIWESVANFFKQVWDWIKNAYYTVVNFFTGVIDSIKGWFAF